MSTPYAFASGGLADSAFRLARRIERAFEGSVKIIIASSGGKASIGALAAGDAELHFGSEHANIPHAAAIAYFAGLPASLGADGPAMSRWIRKGGGQALWEGCMRPHGVQPLLAQHTGAGAGLWLNTPFSTFNGLRIAADGLSAEVFRALGADVDSLTMEEASHAMSVGSRDAVELDTLEDALASGIANAATTCILASPRGRGSVLSLSLRLELWQQFTADDRMRFVALTQAHEKAVHEEAIANATALLAAMRKSRDTRFIGNMNDHAEAIARLSEAVVADISSRDRLARSVTAAFQRHFRHA